MHLNLLHADFSIVLLVHEAELGKLKITWRYNHILGGKIDDGIQINGI